MKPNEVFLDLLFKTRRYVCGNLNAKVRSIFPFTKLDQMEIQNYSALKEAHAKANEKSSGYSRSEREAIQYAFAMCNREKPTAK